MILDQWIAQRASLRLKHHNYVQKLKEGKHVPPEDVVTSAMIDALDAQLATAEELAQLTGTRGQYQLGDTRGFILAQEQRCSLWNCWMVRKPDGTMQHLSENPTEIAKRELVSP